MKFATIRTIADVQPFVAHKKEIKFQMQPNGVTIGCYVFCDNSTFDSPEALECRGIAFDSAGNICSRPLHKFFNVGEKSNLMPEHLLLRPDLADIHEKIDGSMISTAWVDGKLLWRSKKSFVSDVVKLTEEYVAREPRFRGFAETVAAQGLTATFEFTHPAARIVCDEPEGLSLLHVRDNVTGEYLLLDPNHPVHKLVETYQIPRAWTFNNITLAGAFDYLETAQDFEGYVLQFLDGTLVKAKCAWYRRLHRSITFLRERNIAELALNEELDDVKGSLVEAGIDLAAVLEVESRLKKILIDITDEVESVYAASASLDRKSFAIKNREHPYFGMIMSRYIGRDIELKEWYRKRRLNEDFGLKTLANDALAEAIES
jgi:RNA ligase